MTLDMHPKWWRRMAKLFLLWVNLPEDEAERLIDVLPAVEQDRFDAFCLMMNRTPAKALRELDTDVKKLGVDSVNALIDKLPRIELEKLAKAGLKRGKLIDLVSDWSTV